MSADSGTDSTTKQVFETAEAAFQHACTEHDTSIVAEQPLLAMVLDPVAQFGAEKTSEVEEDGCHRLTLKVAAEDGGFVALSRTAKPPRKPLEPGDLVCWVPLQHSEELAAQANDTRFGWIGLVFATLEPTWENQEWALREFYE
jgi:hypothetical protein